MDIKNPTAPCIGPTLLHYLVKLSSSMLARRAKCMRQPLPESTGSCRRSVWSTFPPLCSNQSSAGAVRETVYRRRPGLPSRRTHCLEQFAGQRDKLSAPSVNLPSASKTFLFQASFPDIIIDQCLVWSRSSYTNPINTQLQTGLFWWH